MINKKFDLIGDIHGHYNELFNLIEKLGYKQDEFNTWYHPEHRKLIFVGDYIDRGNQEFKTLKLVKKLTDDNVAIALLGNHEFNAICYATNINGEYIRKHTQKNYLQHKAFLDEFEFDSVEYINMINWFMKLPLFFEADGIKAIHAAWVQTDIDKIKPYLNTDNSLTPYLLNQFHEKTWVYDTLETLLKGIEIELPNGFTWSDKDGFERTSMRFNFFKDYGNKKVKYRDASLSIPDDVILPDLYLNDSYPFYDLDDVLFFGHYWMKGQPHIQSEKTCCLDFSVAKNGVLCAYRWNGETKLNNNNLIF